MFNLTAQYYYLVLGKIVSFYKTSFRIQMHTIQLNLNQFTSCAIKDIKITIKQITIKSARKFSKSC